MSEQRLYIGNLPYRTTEDDVREYFRDYGPIYSVILVYDCDTRLTRGYGFVDIEESAAETVLRELNNSMFLGRTLKVRKAIPKNAAGNTKEIQPPSEYGNSGNIKYPDRNFCESEDFWEYGEYGEYGDFKREDFKGLRVNGEYYYTPPGNYGLYHAYSFAEDRVEYSGPSNKSPITEMQGAGMRVPARNG